MLYFKTQDPTGPTECSSRALDEMAQTDEKSSFAYKKKKKRWYKDTVELGTKTYSLPVFVFKYWET